MFITQINMLLLWKTADCNTLHFCSHVVTMKNASLQFSWDLRGNTDLVWIQTSSELRITSTSLSALHRGLNVWVLFPHKWRIMAAKERQWRNEQCINFKAEPSTWVLNLKKSGRKRRKRCKERSRDCLLLA